jgi:hypothetical protein
MNLASPADRHELDLALIARFEPDGRARGDVEAHAAPSRGRTARD